MYSFFFAVLALATAPFATTAAVLPRQAGHGLNPGVVFTNASCSLPSHVPSKLLHFDPGKVPSHGYLGYNFDATLTQAMGPNVLHLIYVVGEYLVIEVGQYEDNLDIVYNSLKAAYGLGISADMPARAADKYRCFLNLICVAQNVPRNEGTCQELLAGSDCVANRITGVDDAECQSSYFYVEDER